VRVRRLLRLVVVTLSLVVALGVGLSCGPIDNVAFAQEGKITFWIWHWDSPTQEQDCTKRIEIFEKQTGITVEIQTCQWNTIGEKLRAASAAGNSPDAAMILHWDYNWLQRGGILMDITSRAEAEKGIDLEDFNALDSVTVNGKLYAFPWIRAGNALVYNADILKRVGIYSPPNTLAEVKEYAERVTKSIKGVYGFGMILGALSPFSHRWESVLYSCGGDWLNKNATDIAPSFEEAAVETYKFYQDIAKFSPPTVLSDTDDEVDRLGCTGKIAMWIDHMSGISTIESLSSEEILKNIKYAVYPEGKYDPETNKSYRYTSVGDWDIVIPADSRNPEAAWEFMKFWASSETMAETVTTLPTRKSAMGALRFEKIPEAFKVVGVKSTLITPWRKEIMAFILENTQKVVLGKLSPEQASKLTIEKIREFLKKT